jgi:hypothetical protein
VLTSNEERRLGDPIRRRSLYVRIEHPTRNERRKSLPAGRRTPMSVFIARWPVLRFRSGTTPLKSRPPSRR